jgi:hypothetical protein
VASRADPRVSLASDRVTTAVRAALSDFYFNSMRLVPANVVWGGVAVLVVLVGLVWPVGVVLASPLLALAGVVVFRVAAGIVRQDHGITLREALSFARRVVIPASALGIGAVLAVAVLVTNLALGLTSFEATGWLVATLAGWGLVALWCWTLVAWPLLADPARADRPVRARLELAATLLLGDPIRFAGLGLIAAVIVVLSTILTAALLTVSVAFVALVSCRVVLATADRLEASLGLGPG